jgi:acyl-CoA synthetase (AMP-forming)/AMP-acid ligase II/thioesterase domain-containing protein/aryl carrier-like protein
VNQSIHHILAERADRSPASIAILAPGRAPLDFRALNRHVESIARQLHSMGIGRGDRVAIVLPNGPEMATAFLGVASCAVSAPLNQAYRAHEFDFYLSDLNAKALLIDQGLDSPARDVARARGIRIIDVAHTPGDAAGMFHMNGMPDGTSAAAEFARPDDVALVLHTSGTTSRPKIVPLTQRNICTSAFNIMATLALTERDRCLNVMPLFHIHGLMAAVLGTLSAGGSLVCSPGFHAEHFFAWLEQFTPTWYTAVPTMHQTILHGVESHRDAVNNSSLRLIRSSSASLPPQVMRGLEDAFRTPVIEAYGMTEAAHQMASNPLPPRERKPGSVGVAAGPEVAIMDEAGSLLREGETGEIVIRGENVTLGYENNPSANHTAFTNGWFRTGDQGVLDEERYLRITGRIKEMINRGGEKVMPREVDEALLEHPNVAQAVAFALPHPTLGEDLAAAVVLRDRSATNESELREFAFAHLADFKVPSRIVIVDDIPNGPTGKLQRIGLAEKLASHLAVEYAQPTKVTEQTLTEIWERTLGRKPIGIHDNFFFNGGDSLTAAVAIAEISRFTGQNLQPASLFRAPTIEQLSRLIQDGAIDSDSYILPVKPDGSRKPLFLVPGHGGDVFTYINMVRYLHPDQPVYVFRFPEPARLDDQVANTMLREMAALYIGEMRKVQPEGPYHIGGFCYGGELAFEMAQQLLAQRQATDYLAMIFVYLPGSIHASGLRERIAHHLGLFMKGSLREKAAYLVTFVTRVFERISRRVAPTVVRHLVPPPADRTYVPMYYPGAITLFQPVDDRLEGTTYDSDMGWKGLTSGITTYEIPGDRYTIFKEPDVRALAEKLTVSLDQSRKTR